MAAKVATRNRLAFLLLLFSLQAGQCFQRHQELGMQLPLQGRQEPICPSEGSFFYPIIEGECGASYYICYEGELFESDCPSGAVFDPELSACTPFDISSCYVPPVTPEPGAFICPEPDGQFTIPGTCGNKYYNCIDQQPYILECAVDEIFDPVLVQCVSSADSPCNNFECTNPEAGADGLFAIQVDVCIQTYMACIANTKFPLACPTDFVFDPVYQTCVREEISSCNPAVPTTTDVGVEPTPAETEIPAARLIPNRLTAAAAGDAGGRLHLFRVLSDRE